MENQQSQNQQPQQQRIQQIEETARYYTNAADALKNQNEQECTACLQKAQQVAQRIQPQTT